MYLEGIKVIKVYCWFYYCRENFWVGVFIICFSNNVFFSFMNGIFFVLSEMLYEIVNSFLRLRYVEFEIDIFIFFMINMFI